MPDCREVTIIRRVVTVLATVVAGQTAGSQGGTYTYTDDMQTGIFSQANYTAPANEIVDFRALWKDGQDRFTVIGYVKNAFDEVAYQSATPTAVTSNGTYRETVKLNFPRTYGVEFQYRF